MTPIAILDNGGATFDRYTFIFEQDGIYPYWGSSEKPSHPQGFGQYCGEATRDEVRNLLSDNKAVGVQITALDLPHDAYVFYKHLCGDNSEDITEQQFVDAACVMRKRGYAIVIFSPDEVPEGHSTVLEDGMVEAGRDMVEVINEENAHATE